MMTNELAILLALCYLSVKHTIADFFLQFPYQYKNKGTYGHPGGLLHAAIHMACSIPVFLIMIPTSFVLAVFILVGEFVAHYHIDWLKVNFNRWSELHPKTEAFWYTVGVDQLAHYLTYLSMVAVLIYY